MVIRINMSGANADTELASLYAWLNDEADVRRHAQISLLAAESDPSDMGAAFDVIQLIVDSGFQAANLAIAYAAWRAMRPQPPQVTIEHNKEMATLDGSDPDPVEAITRVLE